MKTPKEVLDEIIIGMPDEDGMEEYAKLYHEEQLIKNSKK